ncbi:TNT domain-containing protein [Kineosporia succinea]|uniref:TNT domain-containing protein n=1 Tax=Kineosporia succinea TaxID=84632 RepID=A0ABT9PBB3_9ACTN|nr:TNT domain-containing protein [Kineosporia succinea]MDP9829986.1 hypothetical protein [Kineosporia succinea]
MHRTNSLLARLRHASIGLLAAGIVLGAGPGTAATATAATARPAVTSVAASAASAANAGSVHTLTSVSARTAAAVHLAAKPRIADCSADFADGDRRLGPATLPNTGRVGHELKGYHRTGSLSASAFLAQYYDSAANSWIYPPQNGYELRPDGSPIVWRRTLRVGRELDRFGSEYGGFLSPAGTPYAERAIPPSNLAGTPAPGCNYRRYRVVRAFDVAAGPIAPWFAQRGDGWQYQLAGAFVTGAPAQLNVLWLVEAGYLERL